MSTAAPTVVIETVAPVDLGASLRALTAGGQEPSVRVTAQDGVWRATRTPDGPVTVHLVDARGRGAPGPTSRVAVRAWGPGAAWAVDQAPVLVGAARADTFDPQVEPVRTLHRRRPGLRFPRTEAVLDALLPTILGQKVTAIEARRGWRALLHRFGEVAPGPPGLVLPPDPERLAELGYAALHPLGIERRRADTLLLACRRAPSIERLVRDRPATPDFREALESLPGIGPWTSATVAQVVLGDPDVVITGDYHLPHLVAWNLAGEPRATDARMLELLAPHGGHRGHVVRLLGHGGAAAPARGPRHRLRSISSM